jgi:hypothetical protein
MAWRISVDRRITSLRKIAATINVDINLFYVEKKTDSGRYWNFESSLLNSTPTVINFEILQRTIFGP